LLIVLDGSFLPLAALCLVKVRAEPVDIGNDPRVLEIGKSIINKGAGSVGGVKDVVVHIFGTRAVEVGERKRMCVEREGVDNSAFLASAHKLGLISNWLVGDVFGSFSLAKLIDEDEWIIPKVSCIKLLPAFTRMVRVSSIGKRMVTRASDRDRAGGKATMDDRGRGAGEWLLFIHVIKKDISEGGNVEEMEDIMVLFDVDIKGFILKSLVSEYCDGRKETICPSVKGLGQK
jgi:hypothetical protein